MGWCRSASVTSFMMMSEYDGIADPLADCLNCWRRLTRFTASMRVVSVTGAVWSRLACMRFAMVRRRDVTGTTVKPVSDSG